MNIIEVERVFEDGSKSKTNLNTDAVVLFSANLNKADKEYFKNTTAVVLNCGLVIVVNQPVSKFKTSIKK